MELELREHQMHVIEELREGFRKGYRSQLLYAPTGFGKCLGKDTPVLMYDGSIKMVQHVCDGDLVMGPDGTSRRVVNTVNGTDLLYRVTPTKGDAYVVNSEHILSLRMTDTGEIVNIDVQEYLAASKTFRHRAKGWRADAIPFEHKELPVDPYIFGTWLGDGTTKEPAISSVDPEVINSWYEYAAKIGGRISVWSNPRCSTYRLCDGGFLEAMRSIGVMGSKHIPLVYRTASIEQRRQLLAGIIDTDGYLVKGNYDLVFRDELLALGVCFVARSLGLAAYLSPCTKGIKSSGFVGTYYRITISGRTTMIPCRVPRRQAAPRIANKNVLNVGISVECIGYGEYFGFALEGPDRLFVLGDFTVTHNTEVAIYLMKAAREKCKRSAMVMDRIVLVDQTSLRLTKYGLPHGVYQSGHWKYDPGELIQICSAQTLERRDSMPGMNLLIVDECHIARKQTIEFIKNNPHISVIGLTATPFTKGLASVYENVVTGATNGWLVDNNWLTPLKVFIAKEIDMTGAKKVAGEWSQDVATERGMRITGDIVEEWIKKTHEIYGKPEKTIVFCSGVAHGADLVEQFARKGYNFVSISYKDNDEYKKAAIEDFAKPDTQIHGLIATDILTRGFDVPDVKIGVSARPFSKSLSSHVQQMGRIMRPHHSKDFAVWLDHSGNYLRFREDWDSLYSEGVQELDDKVERAKKEPTIKEKEESKCPACGHLWPKYSDSCPACGHVRQRRNQVAAVAGHLEELSTDVTRRENKQQFYSELVAYAMSKGYNPNWAKHKYREKFGVWPKGLQDVPSPITGKTAQWIKSRMIAYAKTQRLRVPALRV